MLHCQFLAFLALLGSALFFPAQSGQNETSLPTGWRIPATLKSSLSSQKAKVGDTIKLDVVTAVHGKDSRMVVIPAHTALIGTITQASPFHGASQPAQTSFRGAAC